MLSEGDGSGDRGRGASSEFDGLRKGSQHSSVGKWTDSAHGESARASERGLRSSLETIGGELRFGEHMAFDIGEDGLRLAFRHLGRAAVRQVISPQTFKCQALSGWLVNK
jgi:hypothetical protein